MTSWTKRALLFWLITCARTEARGLHKDTHSCAYWLVHLNDISVWEDLLRRTRAYGAGDIENDVLELKENIYRARQKVIEEQEEE